MAVNAPYAGPFYGPNDPQGRGPDKSPAIRGIKRAISRWDDTVLPWAQFDDHFNKKLEDALKKYQKAHAIDATGQYGQGTHDSLEHAYRNRAKTHPLEPAIDTVALMLMQDGYDLKHPPQTDEQKVRQNMANYLMSCEIERAKIHYLQQRPMRSLGDNPATGFYGDCSELVVAAYYWARTHTGLHVPDPSGYAFEGYGNTVSIYNNNRYRKVPTYGTFEIGDVALYGPFASRHATICRAPGDAYHAIFTSHGSEAGPLPTRLRYRPDLFAVVRPRLQP